MKRDRIVVLSTAITVSLFLEAGAVGATLRVDHESTASTPDGSTWALAYPTIEAALAAASVDDEIWVAGEVGGVRDGIYRPASALDSIVIDVDDVMILGGYEGVGTSRDIDTYVTTLSGEHTSSNSGRVVEVVNPTTTSTLLEGFTIVGGNGAMEGAGMSVGDDSDEAGIEVRLCVIRENETTDNGGGLACLNALSDPEFRTCTFTQNDATTTGSDGGAVYSEGTPVFIDCIFSDNDAGEDGGAVALKKGGEGEFVCCSFVDNSAVDTGGAISINEHGSNGPLVMTNCLIADNVADLGGAIYNEEYTAVLINCTIVDNSATNTSVGGIGGYLGGGSETTTIKNCILWGNIDFGDDDQLSANATAVVEYSDIEGGYSGTGNINADPQFVSSTDYRLTESSPCIDSGDESAVPEDEHDADEDGITVTPNGEPTPDRDLEERVRGFDVDMGAWEWEDPCPADTNDDGQVDVDDLVAVILAWGTSDQDTDVNYDGVVDVDDLLAVILGWGLCPEESGSEPDSLEDEVENAGLVYPDDWDDFMDNVEDANYRCWMDHYLHGCPKGQPCAGCPGSDPF